MVTRGGCVALGALVMAGCGASDGRDARTTDRRRPPATTIVAALAPLPGGRLRVGELTTGVIRDVRAGDGAAVRPQGEVARVRVATGGQRGLLGVAVDRRGRTFAAYTARDGHLVVAQVAPGAPRRVWRGPLSTDLADGGHLAFAPGGRLVIGIGDLQDPAAVTDPAAPNGKLLALDPSGPAAQRPRVLSQGWNNPFAFAVLPGGELWVADNAPGRRAERLARSDGRGGAPAQVTALRGRRAPSGLAALGRREVALCGVRSGRLERYRRSASGRWTRRGVIARDCRYGVARLSDGRLAYAGAAGVRVVRP